MKKAPSDGWAVVLWRGVGGQYAPYKLIMRGTEEKMARLYVAAFEHALEVFGQNRRKQGDAILWVSDGVRYKMAPLKDEYLPKLGFSQ